jgi:hypothetical protein
MTYSEEVLGFFSKSYVIPARQRGQSTIEVRAGDIHSQLGWARKVPLVCSALSSKKLQKKLGIRLTEKSGPPSGQSPTVVFHYEILSQSSPHSASASTPRKGLLAAYGAAEHLYSQVGGGDAFLKAERENFGLLIPSEAAREEAAEGSGGNG